MPDVRSPYEVAHAEAYLIRCLVKQYGWRVIEPGVLRRGWRPVVATPAPRSAPPAGSITAA